jgi:hypothetical protein
VGFAALKIGLAFAELVEAVLMEASLNITEF